MVKTSKNDVNGIYKGKRSCGPKLTQKPEKKICEKIEVLEKKNQFRIGNEHTVRDVSFDWPGRYARTVGKPLAGLLPTAGR